MRLEDGQEVEPQLLLWESRPGQWCAEEQEWQADSMEHAAWLEQQLYRADRIVLSLLHTYHFIQVPGRGWCESRAP